MAAPKGNKYAKKDKPKSALVQIRIEPNLKSIASEHAESIGLSLSEYINRLLKSDLGQ